MKDSHDSSSEDSEEDSSKQRAKRPKRTVEYSQISKSDDSDYRINLHGRRRQFRSKIDHRHRPPPCYRITYSSRQQSEMEYQLDRVRKNIKDENLCFKGERKDNAEEFLEQLVIPEDLW